jgi:hypothetical protein
MQSVGVLVAGSVHVTFKAFATGAHTASPEARVGDQELLLLEPRISLESTVPSILSHGPRHALAVTYRSRLSH